MKKIFLFLFAASCVAPLAGQGFEDTELAKLVDIVIKLRTDNQKPSEQALSAFANDNLWTEMTELTEKLLPGEVRPNSFKLNQILFNADNKRNTAPEYTAGEMLSGADADYRYSLIERSVIAGQKVAYANENMTGRSGTQYFVIVLFDPKATGDFNASVKFSNEEHKFDADKENGILKVKCDAKSETFSLTVDNKSNANQSFVVINYNTRDDQKK